MTDLEAAFEEFDRANPRIYELMCRFADQAIAAGRTRIGAQLLFERIRWEVYITTTDEEFKLNNNHVAYYARKWLREHPDHPDFFVTRRVKGETVGADESENSNWYFDDDGQGDFFDGPFG